MKRVSFAASDSTSKPESTTMNGGIADPVPSGGYILDQLFIVSNIRTTG